ncbi:MAG TPA: DUF6229 family protein [Jatrophihabitans sp.]|jgi:hypothetical protein|uniref:DUF6229 family protein n=1 Tax=Jatrophihabitans sp. TaxID=1932789 RepID=UPI002F1F7DF2
MNTALLTRPEDLVAQWRTSGDDNPAGPLFTTAFTEGDLTSAPSVETMCSTCTASKTRECC